MSEANKIQVKVVCVTCPSCGEDQEGFFSDPRGGEFECDECDQNYTVPNDAEIVFA